MNSPRPEIDISPELPRIGHPATLTVNLVGDRVLSNDARVKWTFRARDHKDAGWPWGNSEGLSINIREWTGEHQGTYFANIEDLELTAVRTIAPAIRVALSGGGYRASLFGMGGLLYLVDARANYRIEDIASVSGGSITNAFVRSKCDISTVTPEEFWTIVADFARRVMRSRVLPASRVPERLLQASWAVPRALVLAALFVAIVMFSSGILKVTLVSVVAALIVVVFTLRGFWVERMLKRRFSITDQLDSPRRRVTHAFCATDLVAGEPFYFLTTIAGGFFYSRSRGVAPARAYPITRGFFYRRFGGATRTRAYPLRKAVRASAAFPGAFLPKRVCLDPDAFDWSQEHGSFIHNHKSWLAYCADGGVANNLGTQWHEESIPNDWPYRMIFAASEVSWHPGREILQVAIDASRPVTASSTRWFSLPLAAEGKSVLRVMSVLYENTIGPRRSAAAWERSWLIEEAYKELNRQGRESPRSQRGPHRHVLAALESNLSERLAGLAEDKYSTVLARPEEVTPRALQAALRIKLTTERALDGTIKMPTTLFKRSRSEVADAILAGYLATMGYCHAYEDLGIPENIDKTLERIDELGGHGVSHRS